MTTLDDLQKSSWEVAESKGFHQAQVEMPPSQLATYLRLMLAVGELSEAAEELRAGHGVTDIYYEYDIYGTKKPEHMIISDHPYMVLQGTQPVWFMELTPALNFAHQIDPDLGDDEGLARVQYGKPAGFPIEVADCIIRLLDLAGESGFSVQDSINIKETYNRTRAFMHGKTA